MKRAESAQGERGLGRAWATLTLPHVPPLFASNFLQFLGAQVSMMALQWLITDLTDSRLLITLVGFVQGGTVFLISPLGGVIADRVAKRSLLLAGRIALLGVVLGMGALVLTDQVAIAHVWGGCFLGGLTMALVQPATQTYVFDLVGRERIENAMALNATASGVAHVLGPAAGGALLAAIGIAGTFFASSAGMLLSAGFLLAIPIAGRTAAVARRPPLHELREGFAWVWDDRGVRLVLFVCGMAIFNGAVGSMRPVYARFVLDVGEVGLGGMAAASGAGTILGAVAMASLSSFRRVGVWITVSMYAFSIGVMLYALAFSYEYVLFIEFFLGITGQIWNVTVMAGLQLVVPEQMRGRVIAMVFMIAQLGFLGQPIVGALADGFGDQIALGIFGALPTVILSFVLLLRMRLLRSVGPYQAPPGA